MAITMIVDFFTAAASFGRGFLQAFLTPVYNCIQQLYRRKKKRPADDGQPFGNSWWPLPELNWGHEDFQSMPEGTGADSGKDVGSGIHSLFLILLSTLNLLSPDKRVYSPPSSQESISFVDMI